MKRRYENEQHDNYVYAQPPPYMESDDDSFYDTPPTQSLQYKIEEKRKENERKQSQQITTQHQSQRQKQQLQSSQLQS